MTVNVSVCYYPIETLPPVFRYGERSTDPPASTSSLVLLGYATPFYNVARAVRTIIFSTRNQGEHRRCAVSGRSSTLVDDAVGLNFGTSAPFPAGAAGSDRPLAAGVEFAWIAVSAVTIPLFQWLARRREVHELRANALLEKAA